MSECSPYTDRQRARFWKNVDVGEPGDCWPWKRSTNSKGYGQVAFSINREPRVLKSHKVAWELDSGKQIAPGVRASQTCGNRLCCNPRHIEISNPRVDYKPAKIEPTTAKARGQRHGAAKLTDVQVRYIKYRLLELTTNEIAELLGVGYHSIWDIRQGKTWRHI